MIDLASPASLIVPRIVVNLPSTGKPDMVFSADDSPIERHLVADLSVAYAFDQLQCFTMVARRDLIRLGLDEQAIHRVALANLSDRMEKMQPEFAKLSNGVFVISCGGDFEATMLLLDPVWEQAAEIVRGAMLLRGPLVVSVPSRNMVAFTPAENRSGLEFMRSKAAEILEHDDHALTRHFLTREHKGWKKYEG